VHGPPVRSEDRLPQWKVIAPRVGVELVRSSRLASVPYAYAAVAHDVSRLVFTAGACPLDESAAIVAVGDVVGQAERVMTNLRIALQAAGADLPDVVKTTVYVASQRREDLLAAWGGGEAALWRPRCPWHAARGRGPGLPGPAR
jgi:enamine deaminase RidA (YjgF/YER057c/UK114 family)